MSEKRAKKVQKRKAKKRKKLKVLNRTSRPRECGECAECCIHFPVKGLPGHGEVKPAGTPCMHLTYNTTARCGIYKDPEKPHVCDYYKCLWLYDGASPKRHFFADDRPDILGVIFDLVGGDHPATKALKKPVLVARPTFPESLDTDHARSVYDRFLEKGYVIVLFRGEKNFEFLSFDARDAEIVRRVYEELPDFKVDKTVDSTESL